MRTCLLVHAFPGNPVFDLHTACANTGGRRRGSTIGAGIASASCMACPCVLDRGGAVDSTKSLRVSTAFAVRVFKNLAK